LLESEGHAVVARGTIQDALEAIAERVFDLVFLDIRLGMDNGLDFLPALKAESPWAKVIVITAYASIETAVEAMRRGASDYLPKPFEPAQVLLVTEKVAAQRRLERKVQTLQAALGTIDAEADLPTNTPSMQRVIELARQVAGSEAPILIRGESGTGRGRLARAIHAWSGRAGGPFASLSCQSEVDALEAELFGLSPSQGPAAAQSPGRVPFCDGGTLALEEIGFAHLRLQERILRLLQHKEYERMDEVRPRAADVRLIASTSEDLSQRVAKGTFRADLLMALNIVEIEVPPLRQRPDDLAMLAERYLAFFARENHRPVGRFTGDAMYAMRKYTWPGNCRELRNVIERAVLLCRTDAIGVEHLPPNLLNESPTYSVGDLVPLEAIERSHVERVVASTRSLRRAAQILGVDSSTLCRWMKRYGATVENLAKEGEEL
ncbi:MAG TPA: sigma-54 dependent transcriptional regulator, partial [Tepidisphaeraceae bacterium]|nr:sigma-54 dependent transcriptional regulator [Tepidisphaeraceae bacterium]